jgi:hypothetical protein
MTTVSYAEIFKMIKVNNMTRANYYLYNNLKRDKFFLVTSSAFGLSMDDRKEIFDDAFSHFFEDIKIGKFKYKNDNALFSYFFGGCRFQQLNKIRELIRNRKYLRYLEEMVHSLKDEEFENEYKSSLHEFTEEKYKEYGLEIIPQEDPLDFKYTKVMEAILNSKGQCQTVIVLFYFLKMSHKEIPEIYPVIANENTSKVVLNRCMNKIKKNIFKN